MPDDADLLSTTEAAAIIEVERSTLSRWIDSGRIAWAHQLPGPNGAYLFRRSEVERARAVYAVERSDAERRRQAKASSS